MNIEDTGGTTLQATAAVHLAQATPEPFRRATWLCFDKLTGSAPQSSRCRRWVNRHGWTVAPELPAESAINRPGRSRAGRPWRWTSMFLKLPTLKVAGTLTWTVNGPVWES